MIRQQNYLRLLTVDEYRAYRRSIPSLPVVEAAVANEWWLDDAGKASIGESTSCVDSATGRLSWSDSTADCIGLRPCMWIEGDNLGIGDSVTAYNLNWTVVDKLSRRSRALILCNHVIAVTWHTCQASQWEAAVRLGDSLPPIDKATSVMYRWANARIDHTDSRLIAYPTRPDYVRPDQTQEHGLWQLRLYNPLRKDIVHDDSDIDVVDIRLMTPNEYWQWGGNIPGFDQWQWLTDGFIVDIDGWVVRYLHVHDTSAGYVRPVITTDRELEVGRCIYYGGYRWTAVDCNKAVADHPICRMPYRKDRPAEAVGVEITNYEESDVSRYLKEWLAAKGDMADDRLSPWWAIRQKGGMV